MDRRYTRANYWGYGNEHDYVSFMLNQGQKPTLIAEAIHTSIDELTLRYPDLFPKRYERATGCKVGETRACKVWTKIEDRQIKNYYPKKGPRWRGWKDLLGDRSAEAIKARARTLGIRYVGPTKPKKERG